MQSAAQNARAISDPVPWYRLILHPPDGVAPCASPDELIAALVGAGLAGAPFRFRNQPYFLPGERFLELVVFLGCSPVIELQRQNDGNGEPDMARFCHVHVPTPLAAPRLHVGDVGSSPRCPHCRAPVADWKALLPAWQAQPVTVGWRCPACGQTASAAQLNWRHAAAVLRWGIELGGIHPYEAVPADELLAALETATCRSWAHYYVRPQPSGVLT